MFVYDVGDRASFEAANRYYAYFEQERSRESHTFCLMDCKPFCKRRAWPYRGLLYVVANEIDRPPGEWVVSREDGEAFAKSIAAHFVALSSKTGEGREEDAMFNITMHILFWRVCNEAESPGNDPDVHSAKLDGSEKINARFWY